MDKSKLLDRVLQIMTVVVLSLGGFYFSTLATKAQVEKVEAKTKELEKKQEAQEKDTKTTQGMICELAIQLLDKDKATKICNKK